MSILVPPSATRRAPVPQVEKRTTVGTIPGPLDGILAGAPGYVGTDSAHRHSVVWVGVGIRAGLLQTMPVHTYTKRSDGSRVRVDNPPVLVEPWPDFDGDEFAFAVEWSLCLRGNAYGVITQRDKFLYPQRVALLHPDLVWAQYNEKTGAPEYYTGGQQLNPDDVWHVRRYRPPGALEGLSALSYARQSILLGLGAEEFATRFFTDSGARPTALLRAKDKLNDIQAETIRRRWDAAMNNKRGMAVIGGDLDYSAISVSPADSQFLDTIQASDAIVARYIGIPGGMVDANMPTSGSAITYANREQRALDFLIFYLQPAITRYENVLGKLIPRSFYVKLNTDAMLRMDAFEQAKVNRLRLFNGETTPDELRALADKTPLPNGQGEVFLWPPTIPNTLNEPTVPPVQ